MTETDTKQERRAKIKAKIRALLAKTVAAGCTEEEAMKAAELASRLMGEYDLNYEDIEAEVREEVYGVRRRPFATATSNGRRRTFHESTWVHSAIARFCNCKCWYSGLALVYFGSEQDTEISAHVGRRSWQVPDAALSFDVFHAPYQDSYPRYSVRLLCVRREWPRN